MPELPEVEGLVRFLDERSRGRTVAAADVGNIAALKTFDPPLTALVGATVRGWARHGKWLDLRTFTFDDDADPHLLVHLSRGGWLRWYDQVPTTTVRPRLGGSARGAVIALRVRFDDGTGFDLTEAGTQKRLAVHVVRDPRDVPQVATLGPEPLDPAFTVEALRALLGAKNQQVKGLLRDQGAIAGIGNAYSDEILHVARFSPFKLTRSFTPDDVARLHAAIVDTLTGAVAASSGKPAKELKDAKRAGMRVHGRTGQACPVCGDTVREVSFADRSLQYCATCQTGGQPLADRRLSRLLK
ncbi:DNA-formamidopyrimidine glycosylase [Xylanimonas cellulosilytica DSM 15894]|uniref:DNA-formamidopyrimidine glycosylase n=1 Tax=Xylanimonas cellulosilytica (strain DSM 15894 / JCM 12276 / CECT 5975 / KCTC 9989 / LMG 20990 / NBRC 107835 / XIL07) TaxID=446471 RepID=D1C047_XYLCX|nr:DNA-formamidopyrimidine glycosylase family protein [Xylanimonas cellulosilytica]ACZ30236.1 DNA-formamidopyrimidine glycosylase [Xylanimonas cellulosilytica DSM 15894]